MPIQTVGDMSQQFQSLRQTGRVKSELLTLSQELSTQQKSDLTASLGGDTRPLASLDREINLLEGFQKNAIEIGQNLSIMQTTLEGIDGVRDNLANITLLVTPETADATLLDAANAGRDTFGEIVSRFNTRIADKSLFSGAATDQTPLAPSEDMLADIRASIAGMTEAQDIKTAIDTWFDDPMGGFAAFGYQGDSGPLVVQRLDATTSVSLPARADDAATIALLKGAAYAAVAVEDNTDVSMRTRAELLRFAGEGMVSANQPLTALRASVGSVEGKLAEASVSYASQLTAYRMNRNDLTVADPFETASRLQDVQQQLEMHYTVTARLSRLSLVNYL